MVSLVYLLHPPLSLRQAMFRAEVGDDVFGDDPTVALLESRTAALLGKEAGVFVPSGTMSNLIAVMTHCRERGSEVILGSESHIALYEQGGIATIGGVHSRTIINNPDGTLDLAKVEAQIRYTNIHFPTTKLLCIENTQNACGGRALTAEYTAACGALCAKAKIRLHVDGARIWNAAVALKTSEASLVAAADSVSVCFSKGLGCPIGSVLVGTKAFVAEARHVRKALGGGMRQVGVLAACGLVALDKMRARLADDHVNAKRLAVALAALPAVELDASTVETNLVFFNIREGSCAHNAPTLAKALADRGVLISALGLYRAHLVVHYMISSDDVDAAVQALTAELSTPAPAPVPAAAK